MPLIMHLTSYKLIHPTAGATDFDGELRAAAGRKFFLS